MEIITIKFTDEEFQTVKQVMEFYADTVEDLNFGEKPQTLTNILQKLEDADLAR